MIMMNTKHWNLVADIGGTNARFGLMDSSSCTLQRVTRYSVAQFAQFNDALQHYLDHIAGLGVWQAAPQAACLAVACVVDKREVEFTNSPWVINRQEVSRRLNGAKIDIINDFTAVGHAVADLKAQDWHQIGAGVSLANKPIAILGPGTGLGVSALVPAGTGYQVLDGEGGHVDFAPVDVQEIAVLQVLTRRFGRVSAERLLSGAGLLNIYSALAELAGQSIVQQTPEQMTSAALDGLDPLAMQSLHMFCRVLGSVAGNLALTLGAKGGVYIAGGIVPRFIGFLEQSDFRQRFESKGRFQSYLADVSVRVVTKNNLGLYGAVKKLSLPEV